MLPIIRTAYEQGYLAAVASEPRQVPAAVAGGYLDRSTDWLTGYDTAEADNEATRARMVGGIWGRAGAAGSREKVFHSPYSEPRQFRGIDGYAGFQKWRMYDLRFTGLPDGQICIAAGHEPGQPELTVPAKRFEEWWVGDWRS